MVNINWLNRYMKKIHKKIVIQIQSQKSTKRHRPYWGKPKGKIQNKITRCINYIIPVSIYLAWKCFKPTKKSWWLSLSFDWFTCWNQYVITEPFHYQPPFFNKSMKNLEYYLIDVSFLNPRGMIFCHSLIPRFLDSSRSEILLGFAIPTI